MPELSPSPAINDVRTKALMALVARVGHIDLTLLLVYRLDSLIDSAVIPMAWQFDMLAPQWQLLAPAQTASSWDALTDIDTLTNIDTLAVTSTSVTTGFGELRALLKQAIPLHRTLGTPYAIKTALAALGWTATLQEGQTSWGGTQYPASQGWAVFRVLIALTANQSVGVSDVTRIIAAVNFFKPVRSWLDSVYFTLPPITDVLLPAPSDSVVSIFSQVDLLIPAPSDFIVAPAWPVTDSKTIIPLHNGRYYHGILLTYGTNEPEVADSGVAVNGAAISAIG
jgi:P2-related tail formation protein